MNEQTPRTDALESLGYHDTKVFDLARQLERDLAAANLEIAAAHKDVRDTEARLAVINEKLHDYEISVPVATIHALQQELAAANEKLAALDSENARLLGELAATCLKRKEAVRKAHRLAGGPHPQRDIRKAFPEDFKDD